MNDLTLPIPVSDAPTRSGASPYQGGVLLGTRADTETHAAMSCLFSRLYVDSLFALEVILATPGLQDPSLLVDTHLMAEDNSWGRNQPVFLASDTGGAS